MLTTVQDLGRRGRMAQGVAVGGAADPVALRVANLLVGNAEGAPALEVTLSGPELEFSGEAWVSVCGARFENIPAWRPFHVGAGDRLRFGARASGCRAYLAVAGGFAVSPVLGGCGTSLVAALGGHEGRALVAGDVLRCAAPVRVPTDHWAIDERVLPAYSREPTVRAIPGAHAREFSGSLASGRFGVTPRSDRMGIRLDGPVLARAGQGDLVSTAVAPGTVQVPPDGHPIVLMADAQTLGGYPRVAHVASVDLPLLAQLAPGDGVRFVMTTVARAHALGRAQEHQLALLRQGIMEKMRNP
jgi:antagonist of KipI